MGMGEADCGASGGCCDPAQSKVDVGRSKSGGKVEEWWERLLNLGLEFSLREVEEGVQGFDKSGREVTMDGLVNALMDQRPSSSGAGEQLAAEESDFGLSSEDEGEEGPPFAKGEERDERWKQLRGLGYDRVQASLVLRYHKNGEGLGTMVDWLAAYQMSDKEPLPEAKPGGGVVEELKQLLPYSLKPEFEDKIGRHGCTDVSEAFDLLKALEEEEKMNQEEGMDFSEYEEELDENECDVMVSTLNKKRKIEKREKQVVSTMRQELARSGKTGFGVPGTPVIPRQLQEKALANAPFFYFENVASAPKNDWDEISRHLYGIEPEFVDSMHFSACRRSRGYIHNLPVEGRQLLIPQPPMVIQELFPGWGKHWPAWDPRTKLNCIDTKSANHTRVQRVVRLLEEYGDRVEVEEEVRKEVVREMKRWNLVWTGHNQVSPPTPEELEVLMGFDVGHTRAVVNKGDRHKCLGNSFHVNTVAYHLSVLKPRYPEGMKIISLFAGIGGGEVALYKIGIRIKVLVSIEIEDKVWPVVANWWKGTNQHLTGYLDHSLHDVKHLTRDKMLQLREKYGKFDMLIGGSPCNNLTGNNRCTRTGLAGVDSYLFHDYKRILYDFRELMA